MAAAIGGPIFEFMKTLVMTPLENKLTIVNPEDRNIGGPLQESHAKRRVDPTSGGKSLDDMKAAAIY
eukprot:3874713-Karenia_brevis.AAC.1